MHQIKIRVLVEEDYKSITELSNQLGSKINSETVRNQILNILGNTDHFAFVAEKDKEIVGYIHCFEAIRLTTKPFIEISGLVISDRERRNGIGSKLVKYVEKEVAIGKKLRVRCNAKRQLAHKFYYGLNYVLKKDQKIFEKD